TSQRPYRGQRGSRDAGPLPRGPSRRQVRCRTRRVALSLQGSDRPSGERLSWCPWNHGETLNQARTNEIDFGKGDGLVPVVTQDAKSGKVLMVAYANKEAVDLTLSTHMAHYWSRSRNKLWKKGEESGNVQSVHQVLIDCDGDTLLYVVDQTGPACHTGNETCFFRKL